MRPLSLFLILLSFCFSSCFSLQYFTVNSTEVPKDTANCFFFENDTVKVVYDYGGFKGPIYISVTNKTDKPMYINWKKSAIIENGVATAFSNPKIQVSGTFDATRSSIASSGNTASSFTLPDGMDFIPPGTRIGKTLSVNLKEFPVRADQLTGIPQRQKVSKHSSAPAYNLYSFDPAASPFKYQSYLTFVLGDNNATEFTIRHSFYIQSVMLTHQVPQHFIPYRKGEGDMLWVFGR